MQWKKDSLKLLYIQDNMNALHTNLIFCSEDFIVKRAPMQKQSQLPTKPDKETGKEKLKNKQTNKPKNVIQPCHYWRSLNFCAPNETFVTAFYCVLYQCEHLSTDLRLCSERSQYLQLGGSQRSGKPITVSVWPDTRRRCNIKTRLFLLFAADDAINRTRSVCLSITASSNT